MPTGTDDSPFALGYIYLHNICTQVITKYSALHQIGSAAYEFNFSLDNFMDIGRLREPLVVY